jgi:hypothetical protein
MELDAWFAKYRSFWETELDALAKHLARHPGKRDASGKHTRKRRLR